MRLYSTVIGRDGKRHSTADVVSKETLRVYNGQESDKLCALFLREPNRKTITGEIFVFQLPPQSLNIGRETATSVQDTRHGYVVSENGLRQPTFTLQGHFGWRLRKVFLPEPLKAILQMKGKEGAEKNNFWVPLPWLASPEAEGLIERASDADGGVSSIEAFSQHYDGRTAFFALRDIIVYYHEQNQRRLASGKAPMEMVFVEPQHSLRWVVAPRHPDLRRTVETQGTYPYTLELIGVYDDSRKRKRYGDDLAWSYTEKQSAPEATTLPEIPPMLGPQVPDLVSGGFIPDAAPPNYTIPGSPPPPPFIGPQMPPGAQLVPSSPLLPSVIPPSLMPPGMKLRQWGNLTPPVIGAQADSSPGKPFIGPASPPTRGFNMPTFVGPGFPVYVGPQIPSYFGPQVLPFFPNPETGPS